MITKNERFLAVACGVAAARYQSEHFGKSRLTAQEREQMLRILEWMALNLADAPSSTVSTTDFLDFADRMIEMKVTS